MKAGASGLESTEQLLNFFWDDWVGSQAKLKPEGSCQALGMEPGLDPNGSLTYLWKQREGCNQLGSGPSWSQPNYQGNPPPEAAGRQVPLVANSDQCPGPSWPQ